MGPTLWQPYGKPSLDVKYYYQNIEIEISAETQDHALAGLAKFRPTANYVSSLLVCGGYSTVEEAEEKVLAQAKVLIDNATKSNSLSDRRAKPASWCQRFLDKAQHRWNPARSTIQLLIGG
jgi:hypothetical protein